MKGGGKAKRGEKGERERIGERGGRGERDLRVKEMGERQMEGESGREVVRWKKSEGHREREKKRRNNLKPF